jgi:uncharacterized surface anchored protein
MISACEEPPTGSGPTGSEAISGILSDEQGYIVPGATVEAVNGASARLAIDTTDESGLFALAGLPSDLNGVRLRVNHDYFKPFSREVREVIAEAGGKEGVLVNLLHNDSCCARITVVVTNANNQVLSGVEVRLRRGKGADLVTKAITGENGEVTFENICSGEFNLRLAKDGYAVAERGIEINGCDSTRLEFSMRATGKDRENREDSCCNGVLKIFPRDSLENGGIITGVHVQIKRDGGNTRNVVSNGDGAIFREMCAGTYRVRMLKEGNPGYKVVEFSITIGCDDTVSSDRWMVRGKKEEGDSCCNGKAFIIPRDSANQAVLEGATVKLWKGNQLVATSTVANGSALFERLCKGGYSFSILKDGYRGIEGSFELGCNDTKEITKYLSGGGDKDSCCDGRLFVNVRDSATNAALTGAKVRLWKGGKLFLQAVTTPNGVVGFEDLCSGKYGVDIIREGYNPIEFNVTLACNERVELTKLLLKKEGGDSNCCTAKFKFRVKDSSGVQGWLNDVKVTIKKENSVIAEGLTSGEGTYIREQICGYSSYTVTFSKEGFVTETVTIRLSECRVVEETIYLMPD